MHHSNNGRKWKKVGTEKVLHNEYSRGSGRICKSGKRGHKAITGYWM